MTEPESPEETVLPPDEAADLLSDEAMDALPDEAEDALFDQAMDAVPDEAMDVLPNEAMDALPDEAEDILPDQAMDALFDEKMDALPDEAEDILPDEAEDALPGAVEDILPDESADALFDEASDILPDEAADALPDEVVAQSGVTTRPDPAEPGREAVPSTNLVALGLKALPGLVARPAPGRGLATHRWAALAVLFLTRVWMGFQFQSIPPIAPLLIDDLAINYTQVGWLIGLYMLPGIAIAIPGALLGTRLGDRQVVMIGLTLMGLGGLLTVHGGVFWLAAAGRVVAGVGAVALNVQLIKMVTDWFAGRELATAIAVLLPTWPLGIATAHASLGGLGAATAWQVAALVSVEGTAAALLLMAFVYGDPPAPEVEGERPSPLAFSRREFWLSSAAGWVWMIYNGGFVIIVSFAPAYLIERGASLGEAGFVSSLIMWVVMVSIPLGGIAADRLGRPYLMIVVGSVLTAALVWTLPWQPSAALGFALIGVALGLPAASIMSLPGRVLPPQRRGVGLGIFFTWYYIGMAGFPPLAGAIQDARGATDTLNVAGLLVLLTAFTLVAFGVAQRGKAA